jgi:hypothetical protein
MTIATVHLTPALYYHQPIVPNCVNLVVTELVAMDFFVLETRITRHWLLLATPWAHSATLQ